MPSPEKLSTTPPDSSQKTEEEKVVADVSPTKEVTEQTQKETSEITLGQTPAEKPEEKQLDRLPDALLTEKEKRVEEFKTDIKDLTLQVQNDNPLVAEELHLNEQVYIGTDAFHTQEKVQNDINMNERLALQRKSETGINGELCEMHLTLIFNKFKGEDYEVLRTARSDDNKKRGDILIKSKKTNEAFVIDAANGEEESGNEEENNRIKRKINRIENEQKGLVNIDYGLKFEKDGNKTKVVPCKLENVPIFYICLDDPRLEYSTKNYNHSLTEKSNTDIEDQNLFISKLVKLMAKMRKKYPSLEKYYKPLDNGFLKKDNDTIEAVEKAKEEYEEELEKELSGDEKKEERALKVKPKSTLKSHSEKITPELREILNKTRQKKIERPE